MLRFALRLRAPKPRLALVVQTGHGTTRRGFGSGVSLPRYAQAQVLVKGKDTRPGGKEAQNGTGDEAFDVLERSPTVQAVKRRMQTWKELQAQVSENMNTPEDKERMKKLAEDEPLRLAWAEWEQTAQLLHDTRPLLHDADATMRDLAFDEHASLLDTIRTLAETRFPELLIPPSTTAHLGAIIEIKAGVGGSEAMLFAEDILRMYVRLAQGMGYEATVVGMGEAEAGGVKEAMVEIRTRGKRRAGDEDEAARGPYDRLRWESGVHRVQRVPATEASGRVHTSTVAVLVLPLPEEGAEAGEDSPLYTKDEVKVEVMRSRGAGGQHVNKTESAVRLTHIPTGITVSMQDERSQHQNRRRAFQVLQARLLDRKLTQDVLERRSMRRSLVRSADRSEKIRTYNYAQDRVTDHRLGLSLMNLTSVMEGEGLREFLDALAKKHEAELLEEALRAMGDFPDEKCVGKVWGKDQLSVSRNDQVC